MSQLRHYKLRILQVPDRVKLCEYEKCMIRQVHQVRKHSLELKLKLIPIRNMGKLYNKIRITIRSRIKLWVQNPPKLVGTLTVQQLVFPAR